MDMGLDAQLGNVFEQLTKLTKKVEDLVIVMKEVSDGFKIAKEYIDKFTGGSDILSGLLLLLVFRFGKVVKGVKVATRFLGRNGDVLKGLASIFRGVFGRAMGAIILKFGAWGLAIYAVSEAYTFLSDQIKRSDAGEWTFFDELIFASEKAGVALDIYFLRFKLMLRNMKNTTFNPFDILFRDYREDVDFPLIRGGNPASGELSRNPPPSTLPPDKIAELGKGLSKTIKEMEERKTPFTSVPSLWRSNSNNTQKNNGQTLHATINITNPDGGVNTWGQVVNLMGNA